MRRNCNLELRLIPPFSDQHLPAAAAAMMNGGGGGTSPERQQITIFYNGKISVCQVTEHQARAIIMLAGGGRADGGGTSSSGGGCHNSSMKRSLQQFLQNRKDRRILSTATSPNYPHHPPR